MVRFVVGPFVPKDTLSVVRFVVGRFVPKDTLSVVRVVVGRFDVGRFVRRTLCLYTLAKLKIKK